MASFSQELTKLAGQRNIIHHGAVQDLLKHAEALEAQEAARLPFMQAWAQAEHDPALRTIELPEILKLDPRQDHWVFLPMTAVKLINIRADYNEIFEPVSRNEILAKGVLGTLLGPTSEPIGILYTDGFRDPATVIKLDGIKVLSKPRPCPPST